MDLFDIWRMYHVCEKEFTFYSQVHNSYSRIDLFLGDNQVVKNTVRVEIKDIIWSDHGMVMLWIKDNVERERFRTWRLDDTILREEKHRKIIEERIRYYFQENDNMVMSRSVLWCAFKADMRGVLIKLKHDLKIAQGKTLKELYTLLFKMKAENRLCPTRGKQNIIEEIVTDLKIKEVDIMRRNMEKFQIKYYHGRNRPNSMLTKKLRDQRANSRITTIIDKEGTHKTLQQIGIAFKRFYAGLYNLPGGVPQEKIKEYLSEISLPQVSLEQLNHLNAPISSDEVLTAIGKLLPFKTPGPDGFTNQFYRIYRELVKDHLGNMFNEMALNERVPVEFLQANILPILKKDNLLNPPGFYRPISLTNVDAKLLASISAARMNLILSTIVDKDQIGFVKNRSSCNSLRRLLNILDSARGLRIPLLTLSLDAERAFDRVGWRVLRLRAETLYGPQDPLAILGKVSVNGAVFNSSSAWLVEFYSSWCGHCINYAPTWKDLASDVKDWDPAIRIGVLDCAAEENFETCKDYGVNLYPSFRFFKAFTKDFTQGENYKAGNDRDTQTVRQAIIDFLQTSPPENKPPACPSLEPISSSQVNSLLTQKEQHYTAIIFEGEKSYVGREVILDLIRYKNIVVKRALNSDKSVLEKLGIVSFPSCYLIYPNGSHGLINNMKPLRSLFSSYLKSLPNVRKIVSSQAVLPTSLAKEKDTEDVTLIDFDRSKTYMADLESGLHYLLRVELARHQMLEGEKLKTFKDLIIILYKLFPGRPHVVKLLETVHEWLASMPLDKIPYDAILDLVNNKMRISGIFLTNHTQWVSCQGSKPHLRGYPCSIWKLFHTLTVQAAVTPDALRNTAFEDNPQAVLQTLRAYIKEFFGCRACATHFEAMAKESMDAVKTLDEAILWLWRKHNVVNNRLAGAPSEDPKFPKVQWPTPDLCSACHEEVKGLHKWNENEVLFYFKHHYGSRAISLEFSDSSSDINEAVNNEKAPIKKIQDGANAGNLDKHNGLILKPQFLDKLIQHHQDNNGHSDQDKNKHSLSFLGIGFSNIDMSLCVVLYVTSSLFLMILYFFFRFRSRRWKIRYSRPYV
ncbi:sulfhydryl oxidase 2 [Rhinophrynus dorsalis]